MSRPIPYSRQQIDEEDIEAVVRVLRSDWLTQGPAIEEFEASISSYCQAPHSVAVSSATAGLHLACLAFGVGENDIVWTSPLSFAASANCARYLGAAIDFVDIDPQTGNMSAALLAEKCQKAKAENRLPKVVIVVHYAGRACDMAAIHALKSQYGFHIIEDAAHALGANYSNSKPVGSNADSDCTVFSFHPVKPITTGEGGMVTSHDKKLADKIRLLRSHGITRDTALLNKKDMPAWYYEQKELGFNYRITDFQAALGTSQMKKLGRFISVRRKLAERYAELLKGSVQTPPADAHCGWHLYTVQVAERDRIFTAMRAAEIGVNVHYIPIHLHPYYQSLGFKAGQFPHAENFFSRCLSLPLHQGLTDADQDYVVANLKNVLTTAE